MSTTPPEVTTTTPVSALDENAAGAPTVAANENLTNAQATAEAVATEEVATDESASLGAMEKTLKTSPDIKAAAAKDAHVGEIDSEVADIVTPISEHLDAQQTAKDLGDGHKDATMVGELYPTTNLGETQGTFNNDPKPASKDPGTLPGFKNVWKSGQYAKTETNGAPLNQLEEDRRGLLHWVPKWLLGGIHQPEKPQAVPDNIVQLPTKAVSAEPVEKAA